jgi:hypothetical protein
MLVTARIYLLYFVAVSVYLFFLLKYSKGSPCCAKILLHKTKKEQNCTTRQKPKKNTREDLSIYLYRAKQLRKRDFILSFILKDWRAASSRKPSFQDLKDGETRSKMKLFLCFHICQEPIMKNSMKKSLLNDYLASSIVTWNWSPKFQWIPRYCQHLVLKG